MTIRPIEDADFTILNNWLEARHVPRIQRDLYPPCGLIAEGIAAGFLTTTDTKMALMENFVSNPMAHKHDREMAIVTIIERLFHFAHKMGYTYIVAVTSHPKVEHYIKLSGGKPLNVKMFGKEL